MKDSDIRIDTYTNSSPDIKMRLVHLPTGKTVNGETNRSSLKLKDKLMEELKQKVEGI